MFFRSIAALAILTISLSATAAYRNNVDLISLHYDHAPDRDDGHATVAAYMVTTRLGIQPHVVSGAYGQHNDHRYQPSAEKVMQATWQNNWLNAHSNRQASVNQTAARWIQTINSGGNVYVAEGGQSDFTADVVREIRRKTSINTKNRITVVQHSTWNERMANQSDLSYVKSQTDYDKINDGNHKNGTADLNNTSASFVTKALSGQFSNQWSAAFDYLDPSKRLDFSDTVELLHILEVGKNQVATVNDFANLYFSANPTPVADPTPPVNSKGPQNWSDSYSVNGQCYCDTNFDHGLANIMVDTLAGPKSVVQVCSDISKTLGSGPANNRVYYNTVQCGHNPKNTASDERVCPGIPKATNNYTGPNCNDTGATWNLNAVYPAPVVTPVIPEPVVPEPVVPEPVVPEPVIPEPVVPEPVVPEPAVTEPVVTEPVAPEPVVPEPVVTEPVVPEPVVPESVATDPVNTPQPLDSPVFPVCSAFIMDDNLDGYGWEDNQTCVFDSPSDSNPINDSDSPPETTDTTHSETPLLLFPACSPTIIDTDGDGYGWENNQSCAVKSTFNTPETHAGVTGFPVCSATALNTDSGGYGWENNQSCIIDSQTTDHVIDAGITTEPTTITPVTYPICSTTLLDSDGDSYGWENNQTCTVNPQIDVATNNPTNNSQDSELQEFPVCSATLLDTDADGYGWENSQTCVFSTSASNIAATHNPSTIFVFSFPVCSNTIFDNDSDGYGWENNQTCTFNSVVLVNDQANASLDFPICGDAITDQDGTGYGWENNQSCVFGQSVGSGVNVVSGTTNTGAFDQSTLTILSFPECTDSVDSDGDGFGWENFQTCQFARTSQQPQTDLSPLGFVSFPTCSNQIRDTDGDGYGWENNQSCTFGQSNTATNNNPETITITGTIYPVCSPVAIDDDNNGFAWENNATCVVAASIPNLLQLANFPLCSQNIVDENSDGYGWENNQSCIVAK